MNGSFRVRHQSRSLPSRSLPRLRQPRRLNCGSLHRRRRLLRDAARLQRRRHRTMKSSRSRAGCFSATMGRQGEDVAHCSRLSVRTSRSGSIAIGLALTLARETSRPVSLVDLNLEGATLHESLQLEASPGMSDAVLQGMLADACTQEILSAPSLRFSRPARTLRGCGRRSMNPALGTESALSSAPSTTSSRTRPRCRLRTWSRSAGYSMVSF